MGRIPEDQYIRNGSNNIVVALQKQKDKGNREILRYAQSPPERDDTVVSNDRGGKHIRRPGYQWAEYQKSRYQERKQQHRCCTPKTDGRTAVRPYEGEKLGQLPQPTQLREKQMAKREIVRTVITVTCGNWL
ncbi:MAG: hypothetical protein WC614_00345 [bacterium]